MAENKNDNKNDKKYPWTAKRVIAILAIIALVAIYVIALITAVTTDAENGSLFRFCIAMTFVVPIMAWIGIFLAGFFQNRHTIASFDLLNSNPKEREKMEAAIEKAREDGVLTGKAAEKAEKTEQ